MGNFREMHFRETIEFFDKLSKTSQIGCLELQKVVNQTTVARTELIKATW